MSEDEAPDSDSSGRVFHRSTARRRSRRAKEARVCYSPKTGMGLQDPMPEYVDPELVKLIAQNAPFELDVFARSLQKSPKRLVENGGRRKEAAQDGERRPLAVEAILSSVAERNGHLSARKGCQDVRHSCPERIWSDYYGKEESICRAKRKRRKGFDIDRLPLADRPRRSEVSLRMSDNSCRRESREAGLENQVRSVNPSDEGSNCLEDECLAPLEDGACADSSVTPEQPVDNDCDTLNSKPWRHGMRKGSRVAKAADKPPDSICCKRKAEADSRKTSEVRKYMETKMLERRKEQQQLKADADAALTARKEQQRKLDLHRQAMFQSQAIGGKGRENIPRPAWVSEYASLCEPPRPWSGSSGELNTYLPPPATPPKLEVVPLDLYATQFQYTESHPSTTRVDGIHGKTAHLREKHRSKKVKGCSREVQRQLKYRKSQVMKELLLDDSAVTRKARWKAKTKPRGRNLSAQDVFQFLEPDEAYVPRRSGDLDVYKRSLKRQFHSNGGSPRTAASRTQNSTSRVLSKTPTKSTWPAESCVKSATKDHGRPVSKVKRLKPTQQFLPCKDKELTGDELATLLTANSLPSDRESETNTKVGAQVVAERMMIWTSPASPASEQDSITDIRKCVGNSLGGPQKNTTEEDVLCKWFGPSLESSAKHLVDEDALQKNRGQLLGNSPKPSRSKEGQLQVRDFQNEKTGDSDIRMAGGKDLPVAVRWRRMQLLKNLAEQLVKRVDEACAKKRQFERSAVDQINSRSVDIDCEPFERLSGPVVDSEAEPNLDHLPKRANYPLSAHPERSIDGKKFRESIPEFFHQLKQDNILHCRGLTEQEQAGCETPSMQLNEVQLEVRRRIARPTRASLSETVGHKAGGGPVSEICTMVDWNSSDKGSSSPSTGSSSPVILPTSTGFHMGRIKHSKIVANEEKAQQSKREDWIIPAENDTHSIFNVYSQQLIDREKLATSTSSRVGQNDLENGTAAKMEIDPGIAEPAAQGDVSTIIASIPLSKKMTFPELDVELAEPMSVDTICDHENTMSPEIDGTGLDVRRNQNVPSSKYERIQKLGPGADNSAGGHQAEPNNLKTVIVQGQNSSSEESSVVGGEVHEFRMNGDASSCVQLASRCLSFRRIMNESFSWNPGVNPEVTILEIGDLKLCQSPTSFHLRLDRCKDDSEDTKSKEQMFVNTSRLPNVGNCSEPPSNSCARSKQETKGPCFRNLIPPMKITYARRVNSRARPDGGCTDDERVVVELHHTNAEVPAVPLQGGHGLDRAELDAPDEAPTGMTSPELKIMMENSLSDSPEHHVFKLGTIKEEGKEGHLFSKSNGNGTLQPIMHRVADHDNLIACEEGQTGSPRTMVTCEDLLCRQYALRVCSREDQKQESAVEPSYNSQRDVQIHSQEWELKLRRDQLEAELKKLDAEIMKTRARLHHRHSMLDRQAHGGSSSSLPDQTVQSPLKPDEPMNALKQCTKHMASKERQSVVVERGSDLQMQKMATSNCSPKSRRDGEKKTVASSNSYSDSFIGEDSDMGLKNPGAGNRDSFNDHPPTRNTGSLGGESFSAPQSNAAKEQVEARNYVEMPSAQADYPSEGSEVSTGRGPGRRLETPCPVPGDESTASRRTSKVRSAPVTSDPPVDMAVGEVQPCAQDEGNLLEGNIACAGQDFINTTDICRGGPRTSLDSIPQQGEERVTRVKGQTNRALPCTQQTGGPMRGVQGNVATCGTAEVRHCSSGQQKEGRISHKAAPSAPVLSARASENHSGVVPGLGKVSQTNGQELATGSKALALCQNPKTSPSAADAHCAAAAAGIVPGPPHPRGKIEEGITVVPESPRVPQTCPSPMENPSKTASHCNIVKPNEGSGQMETRKERKEFTCSHEGKINDEAASTISQSIYTANVTPVKVLRGSATKETDWECLSIASHMDFSTIKEKLRTNKLANDEHPRSDSSDNCRSRPIKSPSPLPSSTGEDSSEVQTVANERTSTSDVPDNRKNVHDNSRSPSSSKTGGAPSEGQILANERIITTDFLQNRETMYHYSSSPSTVVSEIITTSDVSITLQAHENSGSFKVEEEEVKGKCPEMEADQENGFLSLPARPKCADIKANPENQAFCTQGLILPASASTTRGLPSFLPSLYFHQQMTKSNPSDEAESTISEDLEIYESDIDEDLQGDAKGLSSGPFDIISSWPPPGNAFIPTRPDSACCSVAGSPHRQEFHSESGPSVTNRVTPGIERGYDNSSKTALIDYDITVELSKDSGASGTGRPSKPLPGQFENMPSSLQTGDQHKSLAAACTSPGSGDVEVFNKSLESARHPMTLGSSLGEITSVSDNFYCASEVSGSHLQSESISEDVLSGDHEATSSLSGPHRTRQTDVEELDTREESNEESDARNDVSNGNDYPCTAMLSSSPPRPDFMDYGDKPHSIGAAGFTTAAGPVKEEEPEVEVNSFSTGFVTTADFQERLTRSGDDSHDHAVLLVSLCESESSKSVESEKDSTQSPHFSKVSSAGELSAKESRLRETLGEDEEHSSENVSGPRPNELVTGAASNVRPDSVSNPGVEVKPAENNFFCCEQDESSTVRNWDVTRAEGSPIAFPETADLEVFGLASQQTRPLHKCDASLSVDGAQKGDSNSENSLAEERDEAGQLADVFPDNLRVSDTPSGKGDATTIVLDVNVNESADVVSSEQTSGSMMGLENAPCHDKGSLIASVPLDQFVPTFAAEEASGSCLNMVSNGEENQLPAKITKTTKTESNKPYNSFFPDMSNGDAPLSGLETVSPRRDLLSLPETGGGKRPQNSSFRPHQIIALQSRPANTFGVPSPLLGHQQFVTDAVQDAEDRAQDKSYNSQGNHLEYNFTTTHSESEEGNHLENNFSTTSLESEQGLSQMYSPLSSLQEQQTELPTQHGTMSESPTSPRSSRERLLSLSPKFTPRTKLPPINVLPKLPLAEDLEACSSDSYSFRELHNSAEESIGKRSYLISTEEKAGSRCCETHEDVGSRKSKPISRSGVSEEQTGAPTCLTNLQEASPRSVTSSHAPPDIGRSITKNAKAQMDADRAEKRSIVTDILTSMIYEDLLCVELYGFHHDLEGTPTPLQTSRQTNQTSNLTKTFSPKLKRRSKKVSGFCQVLKQFLPVGWRSASVRHKTGLFLNVEGLRPHPLTPATRARPGTLKSSYRDSEHCLKTTSSQCLLLDLNEVYTYVQRSFELSSLILDPSPANWYDPEKPVGEHVFITLESQIWETPHIFDNCKWQTQRELLSDLINETLLEQFATKLLLPYLGMKALPLSAGGEDLVQFVTNGIVEHESYASKHGFDIEKMIAKAFEDEQWEKCSEEARDVVGDLAQDILGDLIERFIYEMIRGWCYYINQCHVLAS